MVWNDNQIHTEMLTKLMTNRKRMDRQIVISRKMAKSTTQNFAPTSLFLEVIQIFQDV